MLFIAILAVLLAALTGLGIMFALRRHNDEFYGITGKEFLAVSLLMAVVIVPVTLKVGTALSIANIVEYEEFLNGVETKVIDDVTKCYAGQSGNSKSDGESNCSYTYVSGTYTYPETYTTTECTPKPDGGSDCKTVTKCCHYPTANIYTPYATREHRYTIESSFGFKENKPFTFDNVYLDADPDPYGSKSIPGDLPRGAPEDWLDAKEHLEAGDPRPVTVLESYDNYILASDDEVLKSYSADIDRFKEAGLLPDHTAKISSDPVGGPSNSQAKKLSFVGVDVSDEQEWQDALMRFNAALGMKLQGDLHVVFVDTAQVPSSDAIPYINALKAYWQGATFEKRALAKNGVIVALGITDNQIEWAEATTGMPFGNELMAQYVRDYLPGSNFTPRDLFGEPRTVITGDEAEVTLSSPRGTLEQIMFETAPFERASMSCEEEGCVGFKDLLDTIEPTKTQKFLMLLVTTFLALILWGVVATTSFADRLVATATGFVREAFRSKQYQPYEPNTEKEEEDYGVR